MVDHEPLRFGLTLGNRDLVHGTVSVADLLAMAERAEASEHIDGVWVGDSLLAQPRLESIALLAALSARTRRVTLGTACMGSFPLRDPVLLADQWASLDHLAGGRTVLIACTGGRSGAADVEARNLGVPHDQRRSRMLEGIEVIRRLWREDEVTFEGRHHHLDGVTVRPKPRQPHCPIWVASNPAGSSEDALRRSLAGIARVADGWMTHTVAPEEFTHRWTIFTEAALQHREDDPDGDERPEPGNVLYHNIHVHPDREVAIANAKAYLDRYYGVDTPREKVLRSSAVGDVRACADNLAAFRGSGVQQITLRLCGDDPVEQLAVVLDEVLPLVAGGGGPAG